MWLADKLVLRSVGLRLKREERERERGERRERERERERGGGKGHKEGIRLGGWWVLAWLGLVSKGIPPCSSGRKLLGYLFVDGGFVRRGG